MKHLRFFAIPLLLAALAPVSFRTEQAGQNLEFRLMTIERRLDQLQSRVDVVEREQRMQSLQSSNPPTALNASVLEVQREMISQAQQIVELQRQLLAMRKQLDTLADGGKKEAEKGRDSDGEKTKPGEPARRQPAKKPK